MATIDRPVTIAAAGAEALDAVMVVMNQAFDPGFGEAWTRSQCAGILPMHGVTLTVAKTVDGEVAGFALARTAAGESELLLLAVAPQWRRRGIGQQLLDRFMHSARDAGAGQFHLEVRDGNPAIDLYRAAAFRIVGRRPKYYHGSDGRQFDALTLARPATD